MTTSVKLLGISVSLRAASFSTAVLEALKVAIAPKAELTVLRLNDVPFYNQDVDNEHLLTGMVKRMLEILGYRATAFDEAPKALDYVRSHPKEFDLVISDLEMPGLSGPALARRVWEVRPGLPVLFVSGVSKSLTREAARHLGACDMLLKPFDLRSLGEAVADALRGEAVVRPS